MNFGNRNDILSWLLSSKDISRLKRQIIYGIKEKQFGVDDICIAAERMIQRGRFSEASELLSFMLENDCASEELFVLLIDVLTKQKEYDAALSYCEAGMEKFPNSIEIKYASGLCALEAKEFSKAVEYFIAALQIKNNSFELRFYLGNALRYLGKYEEAEIEYLAAARLNPSGDKTFYNLGVVAEKKNDFTKAKEYYTKAVELNANNADAHWNRALLLLAENNYYEGWKEFEWRLKKREFQRNDLPFEYWDGNSLDGKRILLYDEQGFGDALQFLRFVKYLRKYNGRIDCECKKELVRLFNASELFDNVFERKSKRFVKNEYHFKASLLSLSYLLNSGAEEIALDKPYIKTVREELAKPKIGLVWQGNPTHENDKHRSIDPALLFDAVKGIDAQFVSLQAGAPDEETKRLLTEHGITNAGESFSDFLDAANYLASIDLIITVDTALAHLAGAAIKEVWTLLPANPDWRWGREGEKTVWYPTMKLFRQKRLGVWDDVLSDLREELKLKYVSVEKEKKAKVDESVRRAVEEFKKGNYKESSELFYQAVKIYDGDSSLWNNYGLALSAFGKEEEANEAFKKSIALDGKNITAVNNCAISCFKLGKIENAENILREALDADKNDFETNYNIANIFHRTGRLDEAEEYYRFALQLKPDETKTYYNLSLLLIEKKSFYKAEKIIDNGIAAIGEKAEFLFLKGNIAKEKEDFSNAEKYFNSAARLFPGYEDAWINLAQVYFLTGKYYEAEKIYSDRIKNGNCDPRLFYSLGVVYQEMKKFPESESLLRKATELQQENADFHLALAETLLLQSKFDEGFYEYEMRLKRREYSSYGFNIPSNINELSGCNVLIIDEQGAGDTINFLRFVQKVSKIAERVVFACKKNLMNLASEQESAYVCVPLENTTSGEYDYVMPIASLQKFFISSDNFISPSEKYVDTERELNVEEINSSSGIKVGITWKGNPYPIHNRKRHIDLETFSEIFSVEDLTYFSFQKELTDEENKLLKKNNRVVDLSDKLNDFSDTLALLKQMDFVITVDTAVAHLAGAAGIKTWLLLAYVPDWRWRTEGETNDWYSSVVCFRQSEKRDWREVISQIKDRLRKYFGENLSSIDDARKLTNRGCHSPAIDALKKIVFVKPDDAEALNLLAANYSALGKLDEAEESLNRILKKDKVNLNALINLGIVLFNKHDFDNAFMQFEKAKNLAPENSAINYNFAVALEASGNFEKAVEEYRRALKLDPENHVVKNNLGISLLRMKNYQEGWKFFESRFFSGELKRKDMPGQRWRGEIAKDKTLYVYIDQGFGDAIQFARFLKLAKERVGKLIFEAQAEALPLFKEMKVADKLCAVKPDFSTDEKYDLQSPLLSLPYALNIDESEIAVEAPYIKADKSKTEKWKRFFAADEKLKIGIAWKGNPVFAGNGLRSAPLGYFTDLFAIESASFYCLQKNPSEKEIATLRDFGVEIISEQFTDFSETAAAIANLDLIITTDTVIPHLGGALGKPVLLILAFVSDWRWGIDETKSAWYPSVEIIRQKSIGDWDSVFDDIKRIVKRKYLS